MNWKMKNRVRILESVYKIDEKNKVVVCELKCDLQLHKHPAYCIIYPDMWKKRFPHVGWDGQFTVRAKSRCNNIDTFDEKRGKMIAESRAKTKMFNIAGKVWLKCSECFEALSAECLGTAKACMEERGIEAKHVCELIV